MGRLEKLKALEAKLYVAMQTAENKELAALARQYRETIKDIDELEGMGSDDEVAKIIARSQARMRREPNSNV